MHQQFREREHHSRQRQHMQVREEQRQAIHQEQKEPVAVHRTEVVAVPFLRVFLVLAQQNLHPHIREAARRTELLKEMQEQHSDGQTNILPFLHISRKSTTFAPVF